MPALRDTDRDESAARRRLRPRKKTRDLRGVVKEAEASVTTLGIKGRGSVRTEKRFAGERPGAGEERWWAEVT